MGVPLYKGRSRRILSSTEKASLIKSKHKLQKKELNHERMLVNFFRHSDRNDYGQLLSPDPEKVLTAPWYTQEDYIT